MTVYTTKDEAVEREITAALGEHAADFVIDAMAEDLLEWVTVRDDSGNERVDRSGFALRGGVDFWEVAARHDRAATLEAAGASFAEAQVARRSAVVEAVRAGMPKKRAAELARVSRPTVDKWLTDES